MAVGGSAGWPSALGGALRIGQIRDIMRVVKGQNRVVSHNVRGLNRETKDLSAAFRVEGQ